MSAHIDQALCDVGSALERRRRRQGLTLSEWAARSGISKRGMRFRLLRSDPKLSTIARAADGLGCDVRIVLVDRGAGQ